MIGVAFVLWAKYVPVTLKVPLTPKNFFEQNKSPCPVDSKVASIQWFFFYEFLKILKLASLITTEN